MDFSDEHYNNFAGYKISDNKIDKKSKVNWPKSNWVHIFEMCERENIKLIYCQYSDKYIYVDFIDDIPLEFPYPNAFNLYFKNKKLGQFEETWHGMSSQGRIAREVSEFADLGLSSVFLHNHKLNDDIRSFVCRGRLQLLQCNSLLHLYYQSPKTCNLCNFHTETVSHILNGCDKMKNNYQKRHNRVVDMISQKINTLFAKDANCEMIKDTILKPQMFESEQENFVNPHTRPDIVIINREEKEVTIIEISTPFDAFLETCYNQKFNKYFPLSLELNDLGYRTKIFVFVIGSLGHVHGRFVSGLKNIGFSQTESKFLAKYLSISVIIGSYKIWKFRCKFIDS